MLGLHSFEQPTNNDSIHDCILSGLPDAAAIAPVRTDDRVSMDRADGREIGQQVSIEFKGSHFERDVILWGVRWYVADPISYCQLEEIMEERGVKASHSTLSRWDLKYAPLVERIPGAQVSSGS